MAVPTWERNESKTEYLNRIYELNINIAKIVMNKPKKYRQNYGDAIVKSGLEALKYSQIANTVYVSASMPESDKSLRRNMLIKAKGTIMNISTASYIFLELCKNQDGEKQDKISKQEQYIGSTCYDIIQMLSGVIKSDSKR